MSFYEDERIRNKNAVYNAAYDKFMELKNSGSMTKQDMIRQLGNSNNLRNDIYLRVLSLVIADIDNEKE